MSYKDKLKPESQQILRLPTTQEELEQTAITMHKEAEVSRMQTLMDANYYSATTHGTRLVKDNINGVAEAIRLKLSNSDHLVASTGGKAVFQILLAMQVAKHNNRHHGGRGSTPMQLIAMIGLKCLVDTFSGNKEDHPSFATVIQRIGDALSLQYLDALAAAQLTEKEYKYLEESWTKEVQGLKNVQYNLKRSLRKVLTDGEEALQEMPRRTRAAVGQWVLERILDVTSFARKETIHLTAMKKQNVLVMNPEIISKIAATITDTSIRKVRGFPMIEAPKPWKDLNCRGFLNTSGGYASAAVRKAYPMVRSLFGTTSTRLNKSGVTLLNTLGQTELAPDVEMIDSFQWAVHNKQSIGKLVTLPEQSSEAIKAERKPDDEWERMPEEDKKAYRADKHTRISNAIKQEKKYVRTRAALDAAMAFRDRPSVWFSWSSDYRGRSYPQQNMLQPQGSKIEKVLLRLKNGRELTPSGEREAFIALGVALRGDKCPLATREDVGRRMLQPVIDSLLNEPSDILVLQKDWNADDAWEALALVRGFLRYRETGLWDVPVSKDASQSGAQLLGGVLRDPATLTHTNVILNPEHPDGTPKTVAELIQDFGPEDGYRYVYDAAVDVITEVRDGSDAVWKDEEGKKAKVPPALVLEVMETLLRDPSFNRDAAKQCAMPSWYGATHSSIHDSISNLLSDYAVKKIGHGALGHQLFERGIFPMVEGWSTYRMAVAVTQGITTALRAGTHRAFPKAMEALSFLRSLATKAINQQIKDGVKTPHLKWDLADGTHIEYWSTKLDTVNIKSVQFGNCKVAVGATDEVGKDQKRDMIAAMAPGYVHSLDAALLRETLKDWTTDVITIHDCIRVHPNDVDDLLSNIRRAYKVVCRDNDLNKLAKGMGLTNVKPIEQVEPDSDGYSILDQVDKSRYIFH